MKWDFPFRIRDFIFHAVHPAGGDPDLLPYYNYPGWEPDPDRRSRHGKKRHPVVVFCPDDHHRLWQKYFWKNFTKFLKKILAIISQGVYDIKCCDVIAVKREVAARE